MTKIPLTGHGLGKKVLKCAAKEYVSKSWTQKVCKALAS